MSEPPNEVYTWNESDLDKLTQEFEAKLYNLKRKLLKLKELMTNCNAIYDGLFDEFQNIIYEL